MLFSFVCTAILISNNMPSELHNDQECRSFLQDYCVSLEDELDAAWYGGRKSKDENFPVEEDLLDI
jgi:hypothetical protein